MTLSLAACALPRGAAIESEIVNESGADTPTFQVVEVTREITPMLKQWPNAIYLTHYNWPNTSSGANASVIRTGDMLDITIWDSQDNSLLTTPGQRFIQMPPVEVDGNGSIFLPYVNKVGVRGLTPAAARSKIQSRLEPLAPSAQVQVTLKQGRDHSVDVVGGVAQPGAFPMPSRNYKILNVLADAGGIPPTLRNPRVRLLRGSKTYEISADSLTANGSHNALLQPRDTVVVEEDDRSFTAFGASGKEDLIYFPKDNITALEAMSLMGGLADARANPEGVLVLRAYDARDIKPGMQGPDQRDVVFTFDLTSADGLFAARQFHIMDGDTVLATESPVNNTRTIFALVGSLIGLGRQVTTFTN
ncbi:polysaccharide export protein [Cognatishimia sp. F0-27]|nr:polysaccharide biosynthesis/export family protein [Cognatishimia sp. F0-27]MCC1492396.1 polysaccharide export protein [Cognatishimia sp. F0-27]